MQYNPLVFDICHQFHRQMFAFLCQYIFFLLKPKLRGKWMLFYIKVREKTRYYCLRNKVLQFVPQCWHTHTYDVYRSIYLVINCIHFKKDTKLEKVQFPYSVLAKTECETLWCQITFLNMLISRILVSEVLSIIFFTSNSDVHVYLFLLSFFVS